MTEGLETVHNLKLQDISPNMWNPHQATTTELSNITSSIKEVGQLVPVLVVEWDSDVEWDGVTHKPNKPYLLIDGYQRYSCLKEMFKSGDNNAIFAKAIIIGKSSEYQPWELAEFGQIANHARGSLEDDEKTGKLLHELTKFRKIEDYQRISNQRSDYLSKAMGLIAAKQQAASALANSKASGVPAATASRGYYTVSLPFEDAAEVQEFEKYLSQLPESGKSYRGLDRSYRLLKLMKEYFDA